MARPAAAGEVLLVLGGAFAWELSAGEDVRGCRWFWNENGVS